MFSNSFDENLSIKLEPSLAKVLLIILPHLGILLLFVFAWNISGLANSLLFIPSLVIFLSALYFIRLHLSKSLANSVYTIEKDRNDRWSLTIKDQRKENVTISMTSFISNYFIILNFIGIEDKRSYTAILTVNCLDKNKFRRLKVLVKTKIRFFDSNKIS